MKRLLIGMTDRVSNIVGLVYLNSGRNVWQSNYASCSLTCLLSWCLLVPVISFITFVSQDKVALVPISRHEGIPRTWRWNSRHCIPRQWMKMNGQFHASTSLPLEN